MRRKGSGLVWVLMALLVVSALLGIMWSQGEDSQARLGRMILREQARLLARGALAHGLHKVEKTVIYFDQRLPSQGSGRIDVGREDPRYLLDLVGEVRLQGGAVRGSYRVVSMEVTRQLSTRGGKVFKVGMVAVASVEAADRRWQERMEGEFRLFPGDLAGGGAATGREVGP